MIIKSVSTRFYLTLKAEEEILFLVYKKYLEENVKQLIYQISNDREEII